MRRPCDGRWVRRPTGYNFIKCPLETLGKDKVYRMFFIDTRQNNVLAECFLLAIGKIIFFSSPALQTFSTLNIQHVVLHVKI